MFNNIDGVKTNFDKLSAELSVANSDFSVITLAETNIDSCNKDLFRLHGYQSVYQAKIGGKKKGSGLGIYIKDQFMYTLNEDFSQCTKNLESLFFTKIFSLLKFFIVFFHSKLSLKELTIFSLSKFEI